MTKAIIKKRAVRRSRIERMPRTPEPAYGRSRPMTGFVATLTEEQRRRTLSYDGDDTLGDPQHYKA